MSAISEESTHKKANLAILADTCVTHLEGQQRTFIKVLKLTFTPRMSLTPTSMDSDGENAYVVGVPFFPLTPVLPKNESTHFGPEFPHSDTSTRSSRPLILQDVRSIQDSLLLRLHPRRRDHEL